MIVDDFRMADSIVRRTLSQPKIRVLAWLDRVRGRGYVLAANGATPRECTSEFWEMHRAPDGVFHALLRIR